MRPDKVPHTIEDLERIAHARLQAQPGCEDVLRTKVSLDESGGWTISAHAGAAADMVAIKHGKKAVEGELRSQFPINTDRLD